MLDPTTLLTARELALFMDADTETAASGRLVPIATIVIPIINGGTLSFFAIEELPSTNISAPLIKKTNPTSRSIILNTNELVMAVNVAILFLLLYSF